MGHSLCYHLAAVKVVAGRVIVSAMATYADVHSLALVAGHPALDLVNTVEPRVGDVGRHEHLRTPQDLLVWARRAGLVDEAGAAAESRAWRSAPGRGAASLAGAIEVREALYALLSDRLSSECSAGTPESLAVLQRRWSDAAGRSELRPATASETPYRLVVGVEPGLVVLDRISAAAVQLLTDVDLSSMRACEDGGCGWLFVDRSRSGSRRWCDMADCGAKAKARRLTERRRSARARG